MFLGLALDKQNRYEEAEKAYKTAIKSRANDYLVWQGLVNLYEKQANKKIDEYGDATLHLTELFMAM